MVCAHIDDLGVATPVPTRRGATTTSISTAWATPPSCCHQHRVDTTPCCQALKYNHSGTYTMHVHRSLAANGWLLGGGAGKHGHANKRRTARQYDVHSCATKRIDAAARVRRRVGRLIPTPLSPLPAVGYDRNAHSCAQLAAQLSTTITEHQPRGPAHHKQTWHSYLCAVVNCCFPGCVPRFPAPKRWFSR